MTDKQNKRTATNKRYILRIKKNININIINNKSHSPLVTQCLWRCNRSNKNDNRIKIKQQTELHAVSLRVILYRIVSIFSVHMPPYDQIYKDDLEDLTKQLTNTFVLLADFNCQNNTWRSKKTKKNEISIKKILCIMHYKNLMYYAPKNKPTSIHEVDVCQQLT